MTAAYFEPSGEARRTTASAQQWGISCPDGYVWPDTYCSQETATGDLARGDMQCGCEETPQVVVVARHSHADCPAGPDGHEDFCLNGRQE